MRGQKKTKKMKTMFVSKSAGDIKKNVDNTRKNRIKNPSKIN